MTTDLNSLDPLRQDLQRWRNKLNSDTVEADTQRVLTALIDEASKLLREMESELDQHARSGSMTAGTTSGEMTCRSSHERGGSFP